MKILLVQPYDQANDARLFGRIAMSPLTLPYIASLIPRHHEVRIVDENVQDIDFSWPDIVGITSITTTAPRAYAIADEFRRRGAQVILGGVHPTHMPQEALLHADAVVVGEAEDLLEEVIRDVEGGASKGLYRRDEKPNLKGMPPARHRLLDAARYLNIPKLETSRGCPFNCSFCSATKIFGTRMRYRPIDEVIAELKETGAKQLFFTDNNIFGNPSYAKELFRALIPLKTIWFGQASLNMARDRDLLELASESGCFGLLIGFESIEEAVIESLGKKVNKVSEYSEDIKRLHRCGIGIIGCFIFGFDEEDVSVFSRTMTFVNRAGVDVPQFSVLIPFPGTSLRESLKTAGRVLHDDWRKYTSDQAVFAPIKMPPECLTQGTREVCRKMYSWQRILLRAARSSLHLRSLHKSMVFLGINVFYRRLIEANSHDGVSTNRRLGLRSSIITHFVNLTDSGRSLLGNKREQST
ncbi:MAG: B12-binding domain-containing radical SAM protein [Candidatus Aquicultorales bacterium]